MKIINIIVLYLLQVAFTGGIICLFGLVIATCNKIIYRNLGYYSQMFCYLTGIIGTPIHESAHALMCIIFGHKITEIKFFQIDSQDGVLGYVNHTYNKKNIYQRVGNFFIGIAPIIVGFGLLVLLYYLLLPTSFQGLSQLATNASEKISEESFKDVIVGMLKSSYQDLRSWQLWVFIICGSFISMHMTLSKADCQGSLSGLLLSLIILAIIDIIIGFTNYGVLQSLTKHIITTGILIMSFSAIFFLVAIIQMIVSYLLKIKTHK